MLITVGYVLLEVQKFEGDYALLESVRARAWDNGTMNSARADEIGRITSGVIQATKEAVAVWDRNHFSPSRNRH